MGDSVLLVVIKSLEKFRFGPGRCVRLAVGLFLALFGSCGRLQIDIKFDSKMESNLVGQGGCETFSFPCPFAVSRVWRGVVSSMRSVVHMRICRKELSSLLIEWIFSLLWRIAKVHILFGGKCFLKAPFKRIHPANQATTQPAQPASPVSEPTSQQAMAGQPACQPASQPAR